MGWARGIWADRDWYRHRLADALEHRGQHDFQGEFGPIVWLRPWRFAAGVMFGAALACKWNSVFVLSGFFLGEQWHIVEEYAGILQYVVIGAASAALVWFTVVRVRQLRGRQRTDADPA